MELRFDLEPGPDPSTPDTWPVTHPTPTRDLARCCPSTPPQPESWPAAAPPSIAIYIALHTPCYASSPGGGNHFSYCMGAGYTSFSRIVRDTVRTGIYDQVLVARALPSGCCPALLHCAALQT